MIGTATSANFFHLVLKLASVKQNTETLWYEKIEKWQSGDQGDIMIYQTVISQFFIYEKIEKWQSGDQLFIYDGIVGRRGVFIITQWAMGLDVTQYSADIRKLYESCQGNNDDVVQIMLADALVKELCL